MSSITLEDELALLNGLVQHEGWKLFVSKWERLLRECETSLLAQDNPNREWSAGLVTGYRRVLNYPTARSDTIQRELIKKSKI